MTAQHRERLHRDTCLCIVAENIRALISEVEVKIEFRCDTLSGDISEMTAFDLDTPAHQKIHSERLGVSFIA